MVVINNENIEEYLLLLLDGELEAAGEAQVLAYVEIHPEYQSLLDAFLQTRLEEETIVFEDKESLLKPEPRVVTFPKYRKSLAWAAALLLLAGIGGVFRMMVQQPSDNTPSVTVAGHLQQGAGSRNASVLPGQQTTAGRQHSAIAVAPAQTAALMPAKRTAKVMAAQPGTMIHERQQTEAPEVLAVAGYSVAVPAEEVPAVAIDRGKIPFPEIQESSGINNNWSLIDPQKFEVIDALIAQAETLKEEVQEKAKTLRVNTVAIRLGGREFTIIK